MLLNNKIPLQECTNIIGFLSLHAMEKLIYGYGDIH
jgi:hypothetical protein